MKLIFVYTKSHERLLEEWFLPTVGDEYELNPARCDVEGRGRYMEEDWTEAVMFKCCRIIDAIRENPGQIVVYSDVDVQFFGPTMERVRGAVVGRDIVCHLDAPNGQFCTGFFAVRANDATVRLWEDVKKSIPAERRDQPAFNRLLRERKDIRSGYLPIEFFGTGTFHRQMWTRGTRVYIPPRPAMFHANWTVGVESKLDLHRRVRRLVAGTRLAAGGNNLAFYFAHGASGPRAARGLLAGQQAPRAAATASHARPERVGLETSTVCQLKCPACPTAGGAVAEGLGGGLLNVGSFSRFIREHPWIKEIELSNWGEALLNPDLAGILEYAHERAVRVNLGNGVNLNTASSEALEALVKFGVGKVTCSIDGASQDTYSMYRKRGSYDRVIENIEKINGFKRQYSSSRPVLNWQFVVFGHNQHEIARARRTARRLNMRFIVKLSWGDLYTDEFSPVKDAEAAKKAAGLNAASREEYEARHGRNYVAATCAQLWNQPRINYDGRLLGCSINHWGDYGNVFEHGLESCLEGEKMTYARQMLAGKRGPREDIPCARCKIYAGMKKNGAWLDMPVQSADSG